MRRPVPSAPVVFRALLVLTLVAGVAGPRSAVADRDDEPTYAFVSVDRGPALVRYPPRGWMGRPWTEVAPIGPWDGNSTGIVAVGPEGLVIGPQGGRVAWRVWPAPPRPPQDPPPAPTPPAAWPLVAADSIAVERFTFDADRVFGSIASADPAVYDVAAPTWFLAGVVAGQPTKVEISVPEAQPDGTVTIRVHAFRTHTGPIGLAARWGDLDLGTAVGPAGTGPVDLTFSVRGDQAPRDASTLSLEDRSTVEKPADPYDTSDDVGTLWVDRIDVDVPVGPHDGLRMALPDGVFARVRVLEPTASTVVRWAGPKPIEWTRPASPDRGRWLAIATPPLIEGARRLAAHRASQGLSSAVVSTADLAPPGDAAGLIAAIRRLALAGPRYVVLVGDADRDRATPDTIPTRYARTVYNGATATDRPYVTDDGGAVRASIGRLPFADPAALDAYVTRVIRAETTPPTDATRRAVRFVTSEGRFGPQIDALLENLFKEIVATHIPAVYDVSVTFARAMSDYGWPAAQFNDKVLDDLNEGSLFFTYVGHGWWNGFDDLRVDGKRYPILKNQHVDRVAIRGTPPAMFVIACTTALYDDPEVRSVGERLLDRPLGPLAYGGATRVCHPAWNSVMGRELAREMFLGDGRRLGDLIAAAVTSALGPIPEKDVMRRVIEFGAATMLKGAKVDLSHLKPEGASMYVLLGDPALALPIPVPDLAVTATRVAEGVELSVAGPLPDGTDVTLAVEVPRTVPLPFERDPAWDPEEAMRRRHDRANEKTVAEVVVQAKDGKARAVLPVPAKRLAERLFPTATATVGTVVHVGEAKLEVAR
ncbi:MAG: C25 family cysteine peptidase [Planctomycetota bacterium]